MRTVRVKGVCLSGAGADLVTVEGRFEPIDKERSEVVLTGLPDPVIRESRGRLSSALQESGLRLPHGRLHLNLAPAGRKKAGEILDLPLALAAAAAGGHLDPRCLDGFLFLGELGIDGRLHSVPGGLAAASTAAAAGIRRLVAPPATAEEAAHVAGVEVWAAEHLEDVLEVLTSDRREPLPPGRDPPGGPSSGQGPAPSLDLVRGQRAGKRALEVAAAGRHGLLFIGPPGTGKSLLARALIELIPPLDREDRLQVTRVLSAAGEWPGGLARRRPFRAPHHTTSYAGLVGGGSPPGPGEVTLAHCGVLFLDELPEFRREALEALRQPLETGKIVVSRAGRRLELPARFQLTAAMNPCPCGYLGHPRQPCRCTPHAVQRYRQRISGPLLDRIELRVELPVPDVAELAGERGEPSERGEGAQGQGELAARVARAHLRASERQGAQPNSDLNADQLDHLAPLSGRLLALAETVAHRRGLSARAIQSLRRVARTVADLADLDEVLPEHFTEALALRAPVFE